MLYFKWGELINISGKNNRKIILFINTYGYEQAMVTWKFILKDIFLLTKKLDARN